MSCIKKPSFTLRNIARLVWAALLLAAPPAHATDLLDVRTGLKTVLQMQGLGGSPVFVAVLFNTHDPASEADAKSIAASINSGEAAPPGLKLTAQSVSVGSFSWLPNVRVAFLAQGVAPESFADIARIAGETGVLTMSTDLDCVKANKCVLGISTTSSIQIYYSPVAAEASHISFASAFVMLTNQI